MIGYRGRIQATSKQWVNCNILDADDTFFLNDGLRVGVFLT